MATMTLIIQILAVSTYIPFIWAVRTIFRQVGDEQPRPFAIAKYYSALCMLSFLYGINRNEDLGKITAIFCIILFLYSHLAFWWAIKTVKRQRLSLAFSEDSPEELIVQGPYRWVRHPFYSAYVSSYLASALAAGFNPYGILFVGLLGFYIWSALYEENKFAKSSLRPAYERYCARTGRFTPFPTLLSLVSTRPNKEGNHGL